MLTDKQGNYFLYVPHSRAAWPTILIHTQHIEYIHTERVLHVALKSVCNLKTASHILVYTIFRTIRVKLFIISKAVTAHQDKKNDKTRSEKYFQRMFTLQNPLYAY